VRGACVGLPEKRQFHEKCANYRILDRCCLPIHLGALPRNRKRASQFARIYYIFTITPIMQMPPPPLTAGDHYGSFLSLVFLYLERSPTFIFAAQYGLCYERSFNVFQVGASRRNLLKNSHKDISIANSTWPAVEY
jgi:hypothetical protein